MKKYFFTIFLIILSLFPLLIFSRDLEGRYPRIGALTLTPDVHPIVYGQYLFNFALAVIGIFAFFSLVWAGFQYLTSAGNVEVKRAAKERVKATFLTLAILAFSYLILTTFRKEWERMALISPTLVGTPPTYPTYQYTADPLLHVRNTAKTMKEIIESIKEESNDFKTLLDNCTCGNLINICSFAPGCKNVGCAGDPCPNRQDIEEEQIKLRLKLEELLFYHRLLVDATTKKNLTAALWGRQPTPQIENQLEALRNLVAKLENPISKLRPLIPDYTNLANECEIEDHCEGQCHTLATNSITKCSPATANCYSKSGTPLCPMTKVNNINSNINNLAGEIANILNEIESFSLGFQ